MKVDLAPVDACVSCTAASAGPADSRAESSAVRVLGNTVVGGGSSGTAHDQGQLVALPANPLLSLLIASWTTGAETSGGSSTANSRSALVDLAVGGAGPQQGSDGLWAASSGSALAGHGSGQRGSAVDVTALEAESDARDDGRGSHGHSAGNALGVTMGDQTLDLLHTGSSSDGSDDGYLCDVPGVGRVGSGGRVGVSPYLKVNDSAVTRVSQSVVSLVPATGGEAAPLATTTSGRGLLMVPSTGLQLGGGAFGLVVAGAMTTLASMWRRRGGRARAGGAVS